MATQSTKSHEKFARIPYMKWLTEPIARLLRKNNIQVVSEPLKTLIQYFPSPKHRPPINQQTNVIYKIPCKDCSWSYIGETGRSFLTRKKELVRNVKNYANGSNIANHAWTHNHAIDYENASIIDTRDYRTRKVLKSWHTAVTKDADNNSRPLSRQYFILLNN